MKKALVFLLLALFIAGCGGGGTKAGSSGSTVGTSTANRITVSVKWPARSRLIPLNSNIVVFVITPVGFPSPAQGGPMPATLYVTRPTTDVGADNNPVTSAQSGILPPTVPGQSYYTVTADAYEDYTPGTYVPLIGASLARGSGTATISAGVTTPFTVTLGSQLAKFDISGFPVFGLNGITDVYVDPSGNLTTNLNTTLSSLPINPLAGTTNGIMVTPKDSSGDILLLSTSSSPVISVAAATSSPTIMTISGNTTSLTESPANDVLAFNLTPTNQSGSENLVITYADGGTTITFPVAVSAGTQAANVSLTLSNTPLAFDNGPAALPVLAKATITESNGTTVDGVYTGSPTYSYQQSGATPPGTITFAFANVNNIPGDTYTASYELDFISSNGAAISIASASTTSPSFLSTYSMDASAVTHTLAFGIATPTAASASTTSVAVGVNSLTFAGGALGPQDASVTATFGGQTSTFPMSLFAPSLPTQQLFTFTPHALTDSTVTTVAQASLPLSTTTQSASIGLTYQTRGTPPANPTGSFVVNVLPTAGNGNIGIQ